MSFKPISFEEALPRLVSTYNKGRLVPFTGSGISAPSIPTWQEFISRLSSLAGIELKKKEKQTAAELIANSELVVAKLIRQDKSKFNELVVKSLSPDLSKYPTPQCNWLSKIWWPLILSTNYDTMFTEAYEHHHDKIDGPQISVFGRSQIDCHSLLTMLQAPAGSAYWALQGYFGESINKKNLHEEIVVGHRQYRNVTYNNQIFRSVFAEVFRNYSFFFIGSGLSEEYFTGLFGEVLEKFGNNPHTHCALFREKDIESGAVDHQFLHTRLNTVAVYYKGDYPDLAGYLKMFHGAINGKSSKLYNLGFASKSFSALNYKTEPAELEIVAGKMPFPENGECTVFSIGYQFNDTNLSGRMKDFLKHYETRLKLKESDKKRIGKTSLWQMGKSDIYGAAARDMAGDKSSRDARDLRRVKDTFVEALKCLAPKYKTINIMALASGQLRKFPGMFSLIQMIRGYKKFVAQKAIGCKVRIFVEDPKVLYYMRKNPLEIEELLNCDDMRITVEIHNNHEIERFQAFFYPDIKLKDVSTYYSVSNEYWSVTVLPTPFKDQQIDPEADEKLEDIGLIPGSTLRYTRKKDNKADG